MHFSKIDFSQSLSECGNDYVYSLVLLDSYNSNSNNFTLVALLFAYF